ncbi:MAG: type II CRISPR RNA-guided endonuclease Cas9 [Parvibaculaceae bacterium]
MGTQKKYRLGLDVGANSLGWFVVWLNEAKEPMGLGPGGVRIFPDGRDPQTQTSNAAERRVARGARRRRDRYLERRDTLIQALVRHGLMPDGNAARKALELLDPYELRTRALTEKLSIHHVGRALFHINQRRGFKSNRKSDGTNDEKGAIREASSRLREAMVSAGVPTLGAFLYGELQKGGPARVRNVGTGQKAEYDFYPTRDLLEDEFDTLWHAQAKHHPEMTEAARDELREIMFYQRPLRAPQVGKCVLDPAKLVDDEDGFRLARAHPLSQQFRIWQEVRNLTVGETGEAQRPLSKEDGDRIGLTLQQSGKVTFDKMRKLLELPDTTRFNLESERRKELLGDETAHRLSGRKYFGKVWRGFTLDRQIEIVERLLSEQDEGVLVDWLQHETGVDQDLAASIADAPLPEGYGRLGRRAISAILPFMKDQGLKYHEAAEAAGYDHAKQPTGEILDRLPYYGEWLQEQLLGTGDPRDRNEIRWGRFPNPTVHIGLGQIRRVVNALIRRYGPPDQIVVELARELKNSPQEKKRIESEQKENQKKNDRRRAEIQAARHTPNGGNLLRMRLWEELNPADPMERRCPFTGEVISIKRLFSPEVEVEHLIPFQVSWDDSPANKTLCLRDANRAKGKKTPHTAFGHSPTINGRVYNWDEISVRAANLPKNKRWRFEPDAEVRFAEMGGFLARQLMETSWLARLTKQYLSSVTDPNQVWVIPGRLTAMIRRKWGLNSLLPDHNFTSAKNRADHRHHAIDAVVTALTDRGLLQRMASAYDAERDRIEVPRPWLTFRDDLESALRGMIVSHKPDHGVQGKLHEESAYGLNRNPAEGEGNLVYRKALIDLNENEIGRIRDPEIRTALQRSVEDGKENGEKLADTLTMFGARTDLPFAPHGIRHVRLTKTENPAYLVPVKDNKGEPYKVYSAGENLFVELYQMPDGKWQGEAVTVFQANQEGYKPQWRLDHPGAKFVMRVYKGDVLKIFHDGRDKLVRVVRLVPSNNLFYLAELNEAGALQARHADGDDPFRWIFGNFGKLKEWAAETVRIDELGTIWHHRT